MLVYGKNVAEEVINRNIKINRIYLQDNFQDELKSKFNDHKVIYLKKYEMDKKVNGLHQGIIMDIEDYKYEIGRASCRERV